MHWAAAMGDLGSVGAFGVGGILLMRDLRRQRAAEERAQASEIAAWIGQVDADEGEEPDGLAGNIRMAGPWPCVWIGNASNLPVYDWLIRVFEVQGETAWPWTNGLPLPPGSRLAVFLPDRLGGPRRSTRWQVELRFRDAAARSWLRKSGGALERLDDRLAPLRVLEYLAGAGPVDSRGQD